MKSSKCFLPCSCRVFIKRQENRMEPGNRLNVALSLRKDKESVCSCHLSSRGRGLGRETVLRSVCHVGQNETSEKALFLAPG